MPSTRNATRTAPIGIKIVCVFALLGSILGIFASVGLIGYGGIVSTIGVFLFGISLLYLPIVFGLWTLQSWAWTAYIVVGVLGLVVEFVSLLLGDGSAILAIAIQSIILLYVYSKRPLYKSG
jgi:hypothetical protein